MIKLELLDSFLQEVSEKNGKWRLVRLSLLSSSGGCFFSVTYCSSFEAVELDLLAVGNQAKRAVPNIGQVICNTSTYEYIRTLSTTTDQYSIGSGVPQPLAV